MASLDLTYNLVDLNPILHGGGGGGSTKFGDFS